METAKQISIFLENKPGRLANVLSALAKEKVNVTALTVMDSHEHSVLRVVTDDTPRTLKVLRGLGISGSEIEVLLVELRNQPGALAHICEVLAADHISIDYCYASSGGRNGRVFGIFKVSNTERAKSLLSGTANSKRTERRQLRDKRAYSGPPR
jgi:hypothetical protein